MLDKHERNAAMLVGLLSCALGAILTPFLIGIPILVIGLWMVLFPESFIRWNSKSPKPALKQKEAVFDPLTKEQKRIAQAGVEWARRQRLKQERQAKKKVKAEIRAQKRQKAFSPKHSWFSWFLKQPTKPQPIINTPNETLNVQAVPPQSSQILIPERPDKRLCPTKRYTD